MSHFLRQGRIITRSHHSRSQPRTSRSRQGRADSLHAGEVGLVVIKGVGVGAAKCKLSCLDVFETERFPIEQFRKSLGPVPLVDSLPSGFERE